MKHYGDHILVGIDHPWDYPVKINLKHDQEQPAMLEDGTVNGLQSVKPLIDNGDLTKSKSVSVINLIPLCQDSFYYSLFVIPNGKFYNQDSLRLMYDFVKRLLGTDEVGIQTSGIGGDGDSVLRAYQWHNYVYFCHGESWLETMEFPLHLGRSL